MRDQDLHPDEVDALRSAARALANQNGNGVPRRALVALAEASARYALSVFGGTPPLAVARPLPDADAAGRFSALTAREREVAALLAAGRSNKEIAATLVISLGTVKDHVHAILEKSRLPSRGAVAAAWQRAHPN